MPETPFGIDFTNRANREYASQICDAILDFMNEWNEKFPENEIESEEEASFSLLSISNLYEETSMGKLAVRYRKKIMELLKKMDTPSNWSLDKKFSVIATAAIRKLPKKRD